MNTPAPRNRTVRCSPEEVAAYSAQLLYLTEATVPEHLNQRVICGDYFDIATHLPHAFVDLLILDPPYNLSKNYHGNIFRQRDGAQYAQWFQSVIALIKPILKPTATIYVCADWHTSIIIAPILETHFILRNRITWERDKGRGAQSNWKNNAEDIWFCTCGDSYQFDVDAVKIKKKVIAPYRVNGMPKDWQPEESGNFRLTYPSNLWTDVTVPFWSMPENTDHPTQKPEKLIAKLILASSTPNDFVFDPFLGSGTTAVVAHKLGRRWTGIELVREYCCLALKRIALAQHQRTIQGYSDGVFWERNSLAEQIKPQSENKQQDDLFI